MECENKDAKTAYQRHLGGSGTPFGRGLGRVWGGVFSLGGRGVLGRFWAPFFHVCIWTRLQEGSWRLLSSIVAPFWEVWEGPWLDFKGVGGCFS